MAQNAGKQRWSEIKARLRDLDRNKLAALVGDLYRASGDNRRILHARFSGGSGDGEGEIEKYRRLITDAVAPDPFSKRVPRVGEAKRLMREYKLATTDVPGTRCPERST